ncbi:MBL fold metallo-hydrolase [Halorussus gelatinilyticus]|uniref:MBL fold metallo-hydrolase n=1 Tax=Halorussus gelatinilyticus TaxID=2937524 RepID=A0A8U0II20_9EURY|nr:MBL fold metallo-hydrolase [Halorussus gelatinilyticus]UPW00653.1 MBL fold metallo-hydrolase [Halorussus gelatinilyticus]
MHLTLLGSGGDSQTPMPTCDCRVCEPAREKGRPHARLGNSTFVHEADALVDAPESIWAMLNREDVTDVEYIFLSHHHMDHVGGLRVVQAIGRPQYPLEDWDNEDPATVVMSETTYDRIAESLDIEAQYDDRGYAEFEFLADGETMDLGGGIEVTAVGAPLDPGGPEDAAMGYCFSESDASVLVFPDETTFLDLDKVPDDLDLWVKECGYFRETGDGEPIMTDELWTEETDHQTTFDQTLEQVRTVSPDRTVLTEIEEIYRRRPGEYADLADEYADLDVEFGHDGMTLEV